MNPENSKKSDIHRLLPNLLDKINLRRSDKYVSFSNLSIYYTWINKNYTKTITIKYQLQHGMINLNCLMNRILYQIF